MEGHRRYSAALIALCALAVLAAPAAADSRDVSAETDGNGVDTTISIHDGAEAVVHAASAGGSWDCTWHAAPFNGTGPNGDNQIAVNVGDAPDPDARLYIAWCGDVVAFFWLRGNGQVVATNAAPLAGEVRNRMEVLPGNIGIRPDSRGVTGIPSLFWVQGVANAPMQQSTSAFGLTVTVTAALADVAWNFGDGSPVLHGGLGEPWPQHSSIQHNYRNTSPTTGFPVTVTLTYLVSFQASDGTGGQLQPIVITFTRPYEVHQVQAIRRS